MEMGLSGLRDLIEVIVEKWPIDVKHYPGFDSMDELRQIQFGLSHVHRHLCNPVCEINRFLEQLDHMDSKALHEALGREGVLENMLMPISKILIASLRMASVVGISGENLKNGIDAAVKKLH